MSNYNSLNALANVTVGTGLTGQEWTDSNTGTLMFTDNKGKDFPIGKMFERIEKIEKRLAIIEDPDPEQLENHKMLREAYNKYKFIEGLIGKEDDDNG